MLFRSRRTPAYATLVALLVLMLFATPSWSAPVAVSAESPGVTVDVTTDAFPSHPSWYIKCYVDGVRDWATAVVVYARDSFATPSTSYTDHIPLENFAPGENEYAFRIQDTGRDGICCSDGEGSYYRVTGPATAQ